jgi:hypothetical protein
MQIEDRYLTDKPSCQVIYHPHLKSIMDAVNALIKFITPILSRLKRAIGPNFKQNAQNYINCKSILIRII